jgi:hypothetical protein
MKITLLALLAITVITVMGCSQKQGTSTPASTGQGAGTMTPVPADIKAKEFVTFDFTDVAVSTGGSPVLRLTFNAKNGSNDPLLCDESSFSLELQDGTVLPPDAGAQNVCDPDSIDPSGTSKVVMFFDVPNGYSGPVTLLMRTSDNTLVGQGTTTLH